MKKRNHAKRRKVSIRREWPRTPWQRPHSTEKGDKGYDRIANRCEAKKEMNYEMS